MLIPAGALLTLWSTPTPSSPKRHGPRPLHALALPLLGSWTQLCRQSQMRALVLLLVGFACVDFGCA